MDGQCNRPVTPSVAQSMIALMQQIEERRTQVEAALGHADGTHSYDDIVCMVIAQRLTWWPLDKSSFMLTEVISYPQQSHYHVFLAGGDLDVIRATQPDLINAAKLAGCSKLTLGGRRGWVKALHQLGWVEHCTVMALDLSAEQEHEQRRRYSEDYD